MRISSAGRRRRPRIGTVLAVPSAAVVLVSTACGVGVLDKAEVTVDGRSFRVEVARTARQQQQGLADRSAVPAGSGMLFDFSGRRVQKVWMADTRVPLDAAWIADDAVVAIRTLQPCRRAKTSDCPTWISPQPVDALLEVPAGALGGVPLGAPVRIGEQRG